MMTEACKAAMRTPEALDAVEQFIIAVFQDGDFLNDWLGHVPECGQPLLEIAGRALALALGYPA